MMDNVYTLSYLKVQWPQNTSFHIEGLKMTLGERTRVSCEASKGGNDVNENNVYLTHQGLEGAPTKDLHEIKYLTRIPLKS